MRYVERASISPPRILSSSEANKARGRPSNWMKLDERSRRQRRFKIDNSIAQHHEVKSSLKDLFENRCAYCETELASNFSVTHHRPISNATNLNGIADYAHYVWLAYEWENLYPACNNCNRKKANLFPVKGKRGEFGTPIKKLRETEQGTILDPCYDRDIEDHFDRQSFDFPTPITERGRLTFRVFRGELFEDIMQVMDRIRFEKHAAISKITVQDYKGIHQLEHSFNDEKNDASCLVLIGENATGKSSFLEAVTIGLAGLDTIEVFEKNIRDRIRETNNHTRAPRMQVRLDIENNPQSLNVTIHHDPLLLAEETGPQIKFRVFAFGAHRYFPKEGKKNFRNKEAAFVRSLFDPSYKLPNPEEWLLNLPQNRFDETASALRELLMLGEDGDFRRENEQVVLIKNHAVTPLERSSEGYKGILTIVLTIIRGIYSEIASKEGKEVGLEDTDAIVIIDEIDAHLHPRWKMSIIGALRKTFPNIQFIVSTHDPLCLRGFRDGEVMVLRTDRQTGDTIAVNDLPSVSALTAEQLLSSEYFGLFSTIDPKFEADYLDYLELLRLPTEERDDGKLAEYIDFFKSEGMMGTSRREQLVYEAIDGFLAKESSITKHEQENLWKETKERVRNIWSEAISKDDGTL